MCTSDPYDFHVELEIIYKQKYFQYVITVIDSTDRERLSITKEELYKMLNHEVKYDSFKEIIYLFFVFFIPPANKVWGGVYSNHPVRPFNLYFHEKGGRGPCKRNSS